MRSPVMKKIFLFLSIVISTILACDLSVTVVPSTSTVIPPSQTFTQAPVSTAVIQPTALEETAVTFGPLSLVIPPGVASGASALEFPRVDAEDAPMPQKTPGHLQVMLGDYYILQGKFHQPQIHVYPATAYGEMVPAAFESLRRVNNIVYGPGGTISIDQLPSVPFFNAAQVFASNIKVVPFQSGSGVRFLTEYAQYFAPVNNHELVYHFEGVTRDGLYYIIAIFPVTVPVLAETSDPGAAIPAGGIAYPDLSDPNADFQSYYASIMDLLNATSPEAFTPSISQLDALIQSMRASP